MFTEWSIQDAEINFGKVIQAAYIGAPQIIKKENKTEAVVLSFEAFKQLYEKLQTPQTFTELLLSMPQGDGEHKPDLSQLKLREVEF